MRGIALRERLAQEQHVEDGEEISMTKDNEKHDGAELIHQTIPDVAETEARPSGTGLDDPRSVAELGNFIRGKYADCRRRHFDDPLVATWKGEIADAAVALVCKLRDIQAHPRDYALKVGKRDQLSMEPAQAVKSDSAEQPSLDAVPVIPQSQQETQAQTVEQAEDAKLVTKLTAIVREADSGFEKSGGGSRHWVRDWFLPALNREGLVLMRTEPYQCRHCDEDVRLDGDGDWIDRETHTTCKGRSSRHEPIAALRAEQHTPQPSAVIPPRQHDPDVCQRFNAACYDPSHPCTCGAEPSAVIPPSVDEKKEELCVQIATLSLLPIACDERNVQWNVVSRSLDALLLSVVEHYEQEVSTLKKKLQIWERIRATEGDK